MERKTYITGGPREPKVERARERWYQRAEARDGTSGKEEQLGDRVDPRAEKMRLAEIAAAKRPTPDRSARAAADASTAANAALERAERNNSVAAPALRRQAEGARAEAEAQTPRATTTVVPATTLDEQLRPVPASGAFVTEHTERARAGESLGANQDKKAEGHSTLAPGQQSQPEPAWLTTRKGTSPTGEVVTRPEGGSELQQGALRDTRMAVDPEAEMRRQRAAYLEQRRAEAGQATP